MVTATSKMPRYKCHKEVRSLVIGKFEIQEDGSAILTPYDEDYKPFSVDKAFMDKAFAEGYKEGTIHRYVVDKGGCESCVEAMFFQEGHTEIEETELLLREVVLLRKVYHAAFDLLESSIKDKRTKHGYAVNTNKAETTTMKILHDYRKSGLMPLLLPGVGMAAGGNGESEDRNED